MSYGGLRYTVSAGKPLAELSASELREQRDIFTAWAKRHEISDAAKPFRQALNTLVSMAEGRAERDKDVQAAFVTVISGFTYTEEQYQQRRGKTETPGR